MDHIKERISSFTEILLKGKLVVIAAIFLSILGDILFVSGNSDFRIFTILITYGVSIYFFKIKREVTLALVMTVLSLVFIEFVISGTWEKTEKASVWFILLLLILIAQIWKEVTR